MAQMTSLLGLAGAIIYGAASGRAVTGQDAFSALFGDLRLKQCSAVTEILLKECEQAKAWILEKSLRLYVVKNFDVLGQRTVESPDAIKDERATDGTADGFFTIEMNGFAQCITSTCGYVMDFPKEKQAEYWKSYINQAEKFFHCAYKIHEQYAESGATRRTAFVYRKILSISGGIEGGVIRPGSTCDASKTNRAILSFALWKIPNLIVR